jgi:hypothetical protein
LFARGSLPPQPASTTTKTRAIRRTIRDVSAARERKRHCTVRPRADA